MMIFWHPRRHVRNLIFGFVLIFLASCKTNPSYKYGEMLNQPIGSEIVNDPVIDSIVSPYKKGVDEEMNVILNYAETDLEAGRPESNLGNLMADLTFFMAAKQYDSENDSIDFCLLNKGGIRTSIPQGPITIGQVFQVMPFENELVVLTLSGEKTQALFNHITARGGEPISHAKFGIKQYLPIQILINDIPFDLKKNYTVVTSDYLAKGGDGMSFFEDPLSKTPLNVKLRDVMIEYFKLKNEQKETITAFEDGRIYYEK